MYLTTLLNKSCLSLSVKHNTLFYIYMVKISVHTMILASHLKLPYFRFWLLKLMVQVLWLIQRIKVNHQWSHLTLLKYQTVRSVSLIYLKQNIKKLKPCSLISLQKGWKTRLMRSLLCVYLCAHVSIRISIMISN